MRGGLGQGSRDRPRPQSPSPEPTLTFAKNLISCSCGDFSTRPLLTTASVGKGKEESSCV